MVRLCRLADIADGDAKGFAPIDATSAPIFIVRRGGQVVVYHDDCPHEHGPMAWRQNAYMNAARTRIVCFAHGAEFDVDSGRCLIGPCVGDYLTREPHRIDDGWVMVQKQETT